MFVIYSNIMQIFGQNCWQSVQLIINIYIKLRQKGCSADQTLYICMLSNIYRCNIISNIVPFFLVVILNIDISFFFPHYLQRSYILLLVYKRKTYWQQKLWTFISLTHHFVIIYFRY